MNPISSPFFGLYRVRGAIVLPTLVCLWYLVKLWRQGELYGVQEIVIPYGLVSRCLSCCSVRARDCGIAGFLAHVALAIVLSFKDLIDRDVP